MKEIKTIKTIKTIKSILSLVLVFLTVLSMAVFPVSAEDYGVMPCYNNVFEMDTSFSISASGLAAIYFSYYGYEGITTSARIEIKLQRKTWGLFWFDVETWTRIPSVVTFRDEVTYQLTKTGTYRATVKYEIRGTAGEADTHTFQHEKTY